MFRAPAFRIRRFQGQGSNEGLGCWLATLKVAWFRIRDIGLGRYDVWRRV